LSSNAHWSARHVQFYETTTQFEVLQEGVPWGHFEVPLAGGFNVKNCLAVAACASSLGISSQTVAKGLLAFKNVKRRLEIVADLHGITIFDDFAHHPTAIRETLAAVRSRYPGSRIWAVFEPRSATSRRNVFQKEFSECFGSANQVVLCSLFAPEKLAPSERLDVQQVVNDLQRQGVEAELWSSADEIARQITPRLRAGDKVVIMSNGGFDGIHQKLAAAISTSRNE
jgi:UDP-N-acetylmuramate: L-alanyl-gamma-D-glutamyl-meso-diaminopimelate ligase